MKLSAFATPLAAAALLLSTLSCSKKDDPATPTPTGTGSYTLDNTAITSQSKVYLSSSTSGGLTSDYLQVHLTTTPQPQSGVETLRLYFVKQAGQPTSAYQLFDVVFYTKGITTTSYTFINTATTLTTTSGGGFSGTFSARASTPSGGTPSPYTAITGGVFTDARP